MTRHVIKNFGNFFFIEYGDIIEINGKRYTILGHEYERRFGMEEPKYWVRKAVDQETGEKKIIKFSFSESFETSFHQKKINYRRNNHKEAVILDLCRNHPSFVKGFVHRDQYGNYIQILNFISGPNFLTYIDSIPLDHETYLYTVLPEVLKKLIVAFKAIGFLHQHGLKHGDIRNDHILVAQPDNDYIWIDFDYDYELPANPYALEVFQLGNILINAVGKGFHTIQKISGDTAFYGDLKDRIDPADFCLLHRRRFINLKKIYANIPMALNDLLMRFSVDGGPPYEGVTDLVHDMNHCLGCLKSCK